MNQTNTIVHVTTRVYLVPTLYSHYSYDYSQSLSGTGARTAQCGALRVSCVRAPRARHTHCRTRRHSVDRSSSFQMPSASAKSPHVKTTIVSCIAHNRLQSFRVAHSSSSRSTNVTARRQHAFRLPSASTPPDTRSESKTSIAAHAQASCCSHLAERCWFAQTKAAASAQHVDGLSPLLRWAVA